jgi:predicted acetyltransferase
MADIVLELPDISHEERALGFKEEFFRYNEPVINGSALFDQMEFAEWLGHTQNSRHAESVQGWVPASTFFAVRKEDGQIIGMIDIRHNLENGFLAKYGGHVGYAVRPGERKKGYATQMLRLALMYARSINLTKVMLGCYADNIASIKTIVRCGGVLTEVKPYTDGKPMHVYWIDCAASPTEAEKERT